MRILLLNQYFPPDSAPTGVLLAELAERFRHDGHEVELIGSQAPYRAGQTQPQGRMRRELGALGKILRAGLSARRADVVISASSPPLLLVVATLVARRHRAASIHWAMDLYPELATELGEIGRGPMAALCRALMGWGYRSASKVVALDEDMATRLCPYGISARICRPWVSGPVLRRWQEAMAAGAQKQTPWTWIYSGNLGRAHEWETLLEAQRLIEAQAPQIRLLFQGGGPAWPAAQKRARELGLQHCEWRGYVEEEELPVSLLHCAVCAATQRPEASGLLWPSKLGLLLALPRPILWVGSTSGSIAAKLAQDAENGVFSPGDAEGVARWILSRCREVGEARDVEDAAAVREAALDWWAQQVKLGS